MSTAKRLRWIMARGNLSVADLSRWFGYPHATVRGWVEGGRIGLAAEMDRMYIYSEMGNLERRIKAKDGLPVPRLKVSERLEYLQRLKNGKEL
jgi:hypothetical protein